MARPMKKRRICAKPRFDVFGPLNSVKRNYIFMTLEEYETIRLIDHNDLTQEEAADFMEVARTTVQSIYSSARTKIADSLVNGKSIKIEGGNYRFCENPIHDENCFNRGRRRGAGKGRMQGQGRGKNRP